MLRLCLFSFCVLFFSSISCPPLKRCANILIHSIFILFVESVISSRDHSHSTQSSFNWKYFILHTERKRTRWIIIILKLQNHVTETVRQSIWLYAMFSLLFVWLKIIATQRTTVTSNDSKHSIQFIAFRRRVRKIIFAKKENNKSMNSDIILRCLCSEKNAKEKQKHVECVESIEKRFVYFWPSNK